MPIKKNKGYYLIAQFRDGTNRTLKKFESSELDNIQLSGIAIIRILREQGLSSKEVKGVFLVEAVDALSTTQASEDNALPLTYNGKAIEALGRARTNGDLDKLSGVLKIDEVNIFFSKKARKMGVGAAKIFRYAVTAFTKSNAQNTLKERLNLRVFLDLNDYAQANEIDITSSEARRNFRRKIKGDLEKLQEAGVSWTEKIKGQEARYIGLNYIGHYDIKGDTILVEFTLSIAEYLVSLPMLPYPRSIYKIDDRDANTFAIAEVMCIHYGIDNNVICGTEGRLRVETLLQYTSFPPYDKLQEQKSGWESNVKERFEECLERLYQCGVLKDWEYCTDKNISSYREFISLTVRYEINGYEDSATRIKAILDKRAEKMKKLTQSRGKKHKKS